ncbi:hypothetical protein, partial [Lysinibacillus boronitolerans]|uniref:hypothetical protein n=1 Tax=Lysinibacillus boronitolerans TaxID=309788 RepID=UPI003854175C
NKESLPNKKCSSLMSKKCSIWVDGDTLWILEVNALSEYTRKNKSLDNNMLFAYNIKHFPKRFTGSLLGITHKLRG